MAHQSSLALGAASHALSPALLEYRATGARIAGCCDEDSADQHGDLARRCGGALVRNALFREFQCRDQPSGASYSVALNRLGQAHCET